MSAVYPNQNVTSSASVPKYECAANLAGIGGRTDIAVSAEEIIGIIATEAAIAPDKLVPEATLASLDISSLDVVSIVFAIEDRFGIVIEPEAISPEFTVATLIAHIQAMAAAAATSPPP